jgi:integrase
MNARSKKRDGVHYVGKYAYAWRGGPRVTAPQGTAAFDAEVKRLREVRTPERIQPAAALFATIGETVDKYLDSEDFLKRAPRTQSDYRKLAKVVVAEFGDLPGGALQANPDQVRGDILDWRDQLAKHSKRQADYAYVFFNIVLNWGKKRGKLPANPCRDQGVEKLYTTTRRDKVWTDAQMTAFRAVASPELVLALELGFWTLQRQGDLLALPWSAYDGDCIRLTQNKTRAEVVVPVAGPLKAVLDATPRKSPVMLVNQSGIPWSEDGFRVMWAKTCHKAGVANSRVGGVTYHDLRGTGASRMGRAGCTTIEIASITGHGLESGTARSSLDGYVMRDLAVARSAIGKFEAFETGKKPIVKTVQPIDFIGAKNRRVTQKRQ